MTGQTVEEQANKMQQVCCCIANMLFLTADVDICKICTRHTHTNKEHVTHLEGLV